MAITGPQPQNATPQFDYMWVNGQWFRHAGGGNYELSPNPPPQGSSVNPTYVGPPPPQGWWTAVMNPPGAANPPAATPPTEAVLPTGDFLEEAEDYGPGRQAAFTRALQARGVPQFGFGTDILRRRGQTFSDVFNAMSQLGLVPPQGERSFEQFAAGGGFSPYGGALTALRNLFESGGGGAGTLQRQAFRRPGVGALDDATRLFAAALQGLGGGGGAFTARLLPQLQSQYLSELQPGQQEPEGGFFDFLRNRLGVNFFPSSGTQRSF